LHEEQKRRYNQGNVERGGDGEAYQRGGGRGGGGGGGGQETSAAICFDVQNMIAVPRANVSNLFYERKLNCCN